MSKNYIVLDLEATCDDPKRDPNSEEIIEIGACLATQYGEVLSEFQTFVKPVKQPVLTEFCIGLTHIDQAAVDAAPEFEEAIRAFNEWITRCGLKYGAPVAWCSWGEYDRKQFERNARLLDAEMPMILSIEHMNLKNVYGKAVGRGKKMVGMGIALSCEKMLFEGTPHRGIDDAKNAARLLPIALKLKPSVWVPQAPQKPSYGL